MSLGLIIIGLGNHTKTKLIPVLDELSIPILGIVTSTKIEYYNNIKVFKKLEMALKKNKITHCIISTAPSRQILYIKKLQFLNIKIYVEKPAFTTKVDLYSVQSLILKKGFLTEGLMYRFGAGYKYFVNKLLNVKESNYDLSLDFILPNQDGIIKNSFRSKLDVKSSIIYDIGSYIFDLIWTLEIFEFQISNIKFELFQNNVLKRLNFILVSTNNCFDRKVNVNIGYGNNYKNEIKFISKDGFFNISPFFWGRKGTINIVDYKETPEKKNQINTKGGLQELLFKWFNGIEDKIICDLQSFNRYEFIISELENLERKIFNNV